MIPVDDMYYHSGEATILDIYVTPTVQADMNMKQHDSWYTVAT